MNRISDQLKQRMEAEAKENKALAKKVEKFDRGHGEDHSEFVTELNESAEAIENAVKSLTEAK